MDREKIQRFLGDEVMANAVYKVLLDSFLKSDKFNGDVQLLAASRIAIDLLADGWKDLQRFKAPGENVKNELKQVGL